MTCGRFGDRGDGGCVWCKSPKAAHAEAECDVCGGWGWWLDDEKQDVMCPTDCERGVVPVRQQMAA